MARKKHASRVFRPNEVDGIPRFKVMMVADISLGFRLQGKEKIEKVQSEPRLLNKATTTPHIKKGIWIISREMERAKEAKIK